MFNRAREKNIMNLNAWKQFGVIFSGLWLLVSGFVTGFIAFVAMFGPDPGSLLLNEILPGYILFGLGPVLGFAILMYRQGNPLGIVELIGLGICAAIPFLWFLLIRFWT